jgi:two-component system sensor histidine kinase VicK
MKSIRWRLVGFYVILVIIVMIVSGTLIVTMLRNDAYNKLEQELQETVKNIKHDINMLSTEEELKISLVNNVEGLGSIVKDKQIYLLDHEGKEVYPSMGREHYTHVVISALNGIFSNEFGKLYIEEKGETVEYREYAEPVINITDDQVIFVIYARMSTKPVEENLKDTIFIIIVSILLALMLATAMGALLAGSLTKPISALTHKARDMAKGKLDQAMDVKSDDEIGELTQNFNIMAQALSKTMSDMISEKNKLETVFSHMTDGILVFDKEGKLIHLNPAAQQLFDLENYSTFNEVFYPFIDVQYSQMFLKVHQDIVQHIISIEDRFYNICFVPYQSQNDEYIGIICVIQDVTQHKKLEEMQKEFVANVSHELRTPITTIKSYAETLLDGALEDRETTEHFLEVINNESDRMTNLVQDLLDLSRLDNKQTKFEMRHMNLNHVIEESVLRYQIHSTKKSQIMTYHKPEKTYKIYGDSNRIEQVIKNIISNAVKYSPEHSQIDIEVYDIKDSVVIKIKDTGMGMAKEELGRIFDRFYRIDKARSRAMGGTGLGLAIAKEIMEYHGGSISVESDLGQGASFYLKFRNVDVS